MKLKQMKYYLLLKNNLFDSLYDMILQIDNDRCKAFLNHINRYTLISVFLKALENVRENSHGSIFYQDYVDSNSVEAFYTTIIKPNLKEPIQYSSLFEEPLQLKSKKLLFDEFTEKEKKDQLEKLSYKNFDCIYMISNSNDIVKL